MSCARRCRSYVQLVADLNAGKGTAGKLLKSEELHDQLKASMVQDRHYDRQDQCGSGHDRPTAGEPTVVRYAERRDWRDAAVDQGYSRESQEVPADQTGTVLKRLVVNADDFGFTRDVNEGIVEAHQGGILTATTLMANGVAFDHAVELARANPDFDVGCHLVLVGGKSVLAGEDALPADVPDLLKRLALRRISPYDELRAQVERIIAAGIRPTHLDTHKHTHLLFPVLDAVARLVRRSSGFAWVRRPFDFPLSGGKPTPWAKRMLSESLGVLRSRFHSRLAAHGCRTTDYFAGFQLTGYLRVEELVGTHSCAA